ncbi:MAG: hypothetical protein ACRD72_26480, partial [Candidatus Angelobacter sp.]
MMMKILVALLILLAGVSELMAADQSQSKTAASTTAAQSKDSQSKNPQGKDPSKKDAAPQDAAKNTTKDTAGKPDIHEFVITNFKTESGVTLPQARVAYGTYGHLNAARDNVVLLPSHYMADCHGYEWLIGPDRALDTS